MASDAGTAYIDVEERLDTLGKKLDHDGPRIFGGMGKKMGDGFGSSFAGAFGGVLAGGAFTALTGALGDGLAEAAEAAQIDAIISNALIQAGSSARGLTKDAFSGVADTIAASLVVDDDDIAKGLTPLLRIPELSRPVFEELAQVAADASAATGKDLESISGALSRLATSPDDAIGALRGLGVQVTDTTRETVKGLVAQGDSAGALNVLLEELRGRYEGAAAASGAAAGPQQKLQLAMTQLKESVGTALLPVLSRLASFITPIAEAFTRLPGPVQTVITVLGGLAIGAALLAPLFGAISTAMAAVVSPIALVVAAIGALVAGAVYAYQHFEAFRNVIDGFARFVADAFGALVGWVRTHWDAISEAVGNAVAVVSALIEAVVVTVTTLWRAFGDEILGVASAVWSQVQNIIETAVAIIGGIIEFGLAIINGEWGAAWDAVKSILGAAWDFIRESVVNGISAVVSLVSDVPGQLLSALGDIGGLLYSAGRAIITGLWNGMKDAVGAVFSWVGGLAGRIASLKGPLDYDRRLLTPAGKAIIQGLITGMRNEESNLVDQLARVTGIVSTIPPVNVGGMGSMVLSPGATAGTGGAQITNHNTYYERVDPLLVAREQAWALQ